MKELRKKKLYVVVDVLCVVVGKFWAPQVHNCASSSSTILLSSRRCDLCGELAELSALSLPHPVSLEHFASPSGKCWTRIESLMFDSIESTTERVCLNENPVCCVKQPKQSGRLSAAEAAALFVYADPICSIVQTEM